MSSITQSSTIKTTIVFMGSCDQQTCEDFDLTPYGLGGDSDKQGIINFVYHLNSNTTGGSWQSDQPSAFNSLNGGSDSNKLLCGKAYFIQLSSATSGNEKSIDIPGAILSYADEPSAGKILNPESTKPLYIPDLSKAAAVISDKAMTNFIKDPYVPVRSANTSEIASTKGIMVKSDGTHVSFAAGDTVNITAGSKVFFDTLTHFTAPNNSLIDVAGFFQTDYSSNPFTHTSEDPEDFVEKTFTDTAILIDPEGIVYDDISSPINVKTGWTLIEGKQKRITDKAGNSITLPSRAPSVSPPSFQDFSTGIEQIDLNSSNHELDLNLKALAVKGKKQFKFTGKDWGEYYGVDNLSTDAVTSGTGWSSSDWSTSPTAIFSIDRYTGKLTVINASLPDLHNEGIVFDIPISIISKNFTGSQAEKEIIVKIRLVAAHLSEGNPINYSGSGSYTTEGGSDVTPSNLVGEEPSYDSGIINKSGGIILKEFDYINKIGLIINDDGSHRLITRSPAPIGNLSTFLKYNKPPRTDTLTTSGEYTGSGNFSTGSFLVDPASSLTSELATHQGTLDEGITNTSTSDIEVSLLPFAQTGVIISPDGQIVKVENDGDQPITLPPGATLIRHLRKNTDGVKDAGYTGEGIYRTPSGETVNIESFLALASSGVVNNTEEDKEVFAKPDSILVADDGSVTKVIGLVKNTSGISHEGNTITLPPKFTLFTGAYISESTGSDLNNSGSSYIIDSSSTINVHQELGKTNKDTVDGGTKNNTPITIKKRLKENETGLVINPDGTITTVTTSPASIPPGSVLFIKESLSVQITAHSGGDITNLGIVNSGDLFTSNTSAGAGFTVLFYDFGRIIDSDKLTISGHSFTGGTGTFAVRTSTDAYLDPAETRAQLANATDYGEANNITQTVKTEDFVLNLTEPFRFVAIDMIAFGGDGAFMARNIVFDSEKPTYKVLVQSSTAGDELQGSKIGHLDSENNNGAGYTDTVDAGHSMALSVPPFIEMTRPDLNNGRVFDKWVISSGTGSIYDATDPSKASAMIDEGEVIISPTFKTVNGFVSFPYPGGLYTGINLDGHSVDPGALLRAPADNIYSYINNSGQDSLLMWQNSDITLLVNNSTGETSFPTGTSLAIPSGFSLFLVDKQHQAAPAPASVLTPGSVTSTTDSSATNYTISSSNGTTVDITDIMSDASIYSNNSGEGTTVTIDDTGNTLLIGPDGTIYHIPSLTTELFIPDGFSVLIGTPHTHSSNSGYATWIPIIFPESDIVADSMFAGYTSTTHNNLDNSELIGNWTPNQDYNGTSYFTKGSLYMYFFPDTNGGSGNTWVISNTLGLSANHIATGGTSISNPGEFTELSSSQSFSFNSGVMPDTDGDGVGDNADAFPNDDTETTDSDGDGVGDNADAFPNDDTETTDSDSDGVGDNADGAPNDSSSTTTPPQPASVLASADHTVTWNTGDKIMIPALNSDGTFYYATLEPNFTGLTGSDYLAAYAIANAVSSPHNQAGALARVAAPIGLNISHNGGQLIITQTANGALPDGKTSIIHAQNGVQTTSGILTGSFSGGTPVPAIDNTRGLGDLVSTISLSANANLGASGVADNSIHQTMTPNQVDYGKFGFEILYKPKQGKSRIQVGVTIGGVEMWSVEDSTTGIETTLNNTLDSSFSSIMGQPTVDIENDWRVLRIVVPGTYNNQYGTGNTGNFVFHIGLSHETESGGGIEIATNRNNCPVLNTSYSVNPTSTNWDLYRSNANFDGQFTHGYYRSADNGLCNRVWFGAMGGSSTYTWDGNYFLGDNGQYDLNGHPYYRHESNNHIIRWSTIHNQFGIYDGGHAGNSPKGSPNEFSHKLQTTNATSSSDCVYKLNWEWNTVYGTQVGTTSVQYSQTSTSGTNTTPLSTSAWGKSQDASGNEEIDYSMYVAPVIGNTLLSTEESYGPPA